VRILSGAEADERVDLKQLDATEGRHVLSIIRAIPPPVFARADDAILEEEVAAAVAAMPLELPPLDPLQGGLSQPPAARVSGLHARIVLPPRVRSSAPPADATPEDLERSYLEVLGSLEHVPRVVAAGAELSKQSLDHFAGYVLTFIDGASSVEAVVDASGLPRLEALRVLRDLVVAGVVAVG
jgi:hypothetical protein